MSVYCKISSFFQNLNLMYVYILRWFVERFLLTIASCVYSGKSLVESLPPLSHRPNLGRRHGFMGFGDLSSFFSGKKCFVVRPSCVCVRREYAGAGMNEGRGFRDYVTLFFGRLRSRFTDRVFADTFSPSGIQQ